MDPYGVNYESGEYFRHWGEICLRKYQITRYDNNPMGGNIFFLSIFAAALQPQIYLAIKHRTLSIGTFLTAGVILEILGYIGAVYNSIDHIEVSYQILTFSASQFKSAFFLAGIYCVLARLIVVFDGDDAEGVKSAKWRPRTYTLVFLTCSFVTLGVQVVAVGMLAGGQYFEAAMPLLMVILASDALQIISLLAFIGFTTQLGLAWLSKSKQGTLNKKYAAIYQSKKFKLSVYALAQATLTLFVRCIYNVIHRAYTLSPGHFGTPIIYNVITFFVLDGAMMGLSVLALTVFYPGAAFSGDVWREASVGFFGKKFGGSRNGHIVQEEGVRTEVGSFESVRKEEARAEVAGAK